MSFVCLDRGYDAVFSGIKDVNMLAKLLALSLIESPMNLVVSLFRTESNTLNGAFISALIPSSTPLVVENADCADCTVAFPILSNGFVTHVTGL